MILASYPTAAPAVRLAQKGRSALEQDSLESLLARANAGDAAAFGRFLTRISPVLRGIIRARGRALPEHLHEDILQEVLLALHLKRQSWRAGTPLRPWVYAIARYKIVDAFRRQGAAIHLPIEDFEALLPAESADLDAGRDVEALLRQLDARGADLVRAVALNGVSVEAAGAHQGLVAGTARVALHRAMKKLTDLAGRRER